MNSGVPGVLDSEAGKGGPLRTVSLLHSSGYLVPSLRGRHCGLPWWPSGKESALQYRGQGFNPWSGAIPRAAGEVSPTQHNY